MVPEAVGNVGATATPESEAAAGEKPTEKAPAGGGTKKKLVGKFEAAKCPHCFQQVVKATTPDGEFWLEPRIEVMIVAQMEDGEVKVLAAPGGKMYANHKSVCFSPTVLRDLLKKRGILK